MGQAVRIENDGAARYRILVARELVDDITRIDDALKASQKRIAIAVSASGTSVTNIVGVSPIGAATIIGYTRDVTRFPTKGHYATDNATPPIEVSSAGNTRHRLNLRGNRILNHAIHIGAVTQLRNDTNGRIYHDTKIAESKTPERSPPGTQATHHRRRPQDPDHRRSKTRHELNRGWVREDNQERLASRVASPRS